MKLTEAYTYPELWNHIRYGHGKIPVHGLSDPSFPNFMDLEMQHRFLSSQGEDAAFEAIRINTALKLYQRLCADDPLWVSSQRFGHDTGELLALYREWTVEADD